MRLIGLAVLATLASAPALAGGDPCKGVQVKKDAFGSSRSFSAGDLKIKKVGEAWTFTIGTNKGGGYGGFSSTNLEQIAAGTTIEVMLADGTRVELQTSAVAGGQIVSVMGVTVTHYELPMTVTAEQLQQLVSQPIKAFQVMRGADQWTSGEFKNGDATKFKDTVMCMMGS
ncbi:MAG TPA: hypothetical protein PKA64_15240 [Myxococcota bacterium]|nr:hypothetical protein [Myxococcota bacterium]